MAAESLTDGHHHVTRDWPDRRAGHIDFQRVQNLSVSTLALLGKPAVAALGIGVATFALAYWMLHSRGYLAGDFTWALEGAHRILAGLDPYNDPHLGAGHPYPFDQAETYPLPALWVAIPFTVLNPYLAGAAFYAAGSGLLAYGLVRSREYHRLPLFVSPSFIVGATVAQWPPLMMASAFIPWLQVVAICKPNLGLPILLLWFRKYPFLAAAAFGTATVALMPLWPLHWLNDDPGQGQMPPVLVVPGFVLLLAILRWKTREGRVLMWMSIAPQLLFFYNQLMLWLIPRTWRQSIFMLATNWCGYLVWTFAVLDRLGSSAATDAVTSAFPFVVVFFYGPALAIVLAQPAPEVTHAGQRRSIRGETCTFYPAMSCRDFTKRAPLNGRLLVDRIAVGAKWIAKRGSRYGRRCHCRDV